VGAGGAERGESNPGVAGSAGPGPAHRRDCRAQRSGPLPHHTSRQQGQQFFIRGSGPIRFQIQLLYRRLRKKANMNEKMQRLLKFILLTMHVNYQGKFNSRSTIEMHGIHT
jgi:hypothetical protein